MKTKKRVELIVLLISLVQILLMINTIAAQSYIINQTHNSINDLSIEHNLRYSVPEIAGFLIGLLSIKQIGTVSAAEDLEFNCCVETNAGASCQEIGSGLFPSDDPSSCENPSEGRCQENIQCQIGTCIYDEGLSCSANSPKQECLNGGGEWSSDSTFEIPACTKGACILGNDIDYVTEKQCVLLSESEGLDMDFRAGVSELEFIFLEQEIQKGACILSGNNCRFVTINECDAMLGSFFEDMLCTNPSLGGNCNNTEDTICVDDQIHFVDSCGNPGNIYDASKINDQEYWNVVADITETCTINLDDPESIRNCGSCNLFASSKCTLDPEKATYGDNVCKNLKCTDENGNERLNGEKWCVYDGFVGDGKDTVGSEHWLSYCNNGEVEVDLCGGYRGQICEQRVIEEEGLTFSTASCVVNQAFLCLDQSQSCGENAHCMTKNVDIDSSFQFDVCVPKYPRGFDQKDTKDANTICSIASNECTVTYQKDFFGRWECINNCDCEKAEFTEKMNDLCISLGDCGSYVNYQGGGSNNIQVTNAPTISWTNYKGFANVVKGQYIDAAEASNLVSPIGTSLSKFTPEEANELLASIGASGIGYGIQLGVAYFAPVQLASFAAVSGGGAPVGGGIAGFGGVSNAIGAASLTSFGIGAVGGIVGSFAGKFIVESFGISGTAATVVVMAASIAGSSGALLLASQANIIALAAPLVSALAVVFVIAIIIIIFIVVVGWGQTKEVKVEFACLPWQAPTGGSDCEKCNEDPDKPCTRYRCESLGQACRILNENTENPLCQSITKESTPPVISPGEIRKEGYEFQNQETKKIEIRKENGACIQEFTPVEFTLITDENAQCKWELKSTRNYNEMSQYPVEGTNYALEHGFVVQGLSLSLLEANDITGNLIEGFTGNLDMYVRCQDFHGNFNINEYIVNFCINTGPDETPVEHSFTNFSPANNGVLEFDKKETNLTMWINEPAECKYDIVEGKNYDEMDNSFACNDNLGGRELKGWSCTTTLSNLQNENNFYIKCKDQPWKMGEEDSKRNTNVEDLNYKISVSEKELNIDSIYVVFNERRTDLNSESIPEISGDGASFSIKIGAETSGGSHDGIALCSYESNGNFIPFLNSNTKTHEQELLLVNGDYDVSLKCTDPSGNEAAETREFKLNVDSSPPNVARVYYDSGNLNLITNEQAKCYVSFDNVKQCGFNINDVKSVNPIFSTQHVVDWKTDETYYIKCEDLFGKVNPSCIIKINPSPI